MEIGIERLTVLVLLLTGLSHLLQPKAWVRFFIAIRERGEAAGLLNAYVHAPLGLLIVAFHNVWTWPEAVFTLIGWSLTLKGAIYFCWPQLALRSLADLSEAKAWRFRLAGAVAVTGSMGLAWIALTD
ncbi:MAG TPA: hypothetical protein VF559_00540 [Caulobacteraceae bacterium]|jgi:uncharacterized protein YjeT (DUF2065 family)